MLWLNANGEEPLLPGLTDFNQRQLFWIRNAHRFCYVYTKDSLWYQMEDVHTPDKYRLIGSLMLSEEFVRDFNCPVGSYMTPSQNCSVGSLWPENPLNGVGDKALESFKNFKNDNRKSSQNLGIKCRSNVMLLIVVFVGLLMIIC